MTNDLDALGDAIGHAVSDAIDDATHTPTYTFTLQLPDTVAYADDDPTAITEY